MIRSIRRTVFSLYERRLLRNWLYTFAFAIFVPVGFRFAILAWRFGGFFDKLMTIVGGLVVGITTAVTLLRIWAVPPRQTVNHGSDTVREAARADFRPSAEEILMAVRGRSARNREIAKGARALGSTRSLHY
jgi:hypothetical protein